MGAVHLDTVAAARTVAVDPVLGSAPSHLRKVTVAGRTVSKGHTAEELVVVATSMVTGVPAGRRTARLVDIVGTGIRLFALLDSCTGSRSSLAAHTAVAMVSIAGGLRRSATVARYVVAADNVEEPTDEQRED